MENENSGHKRRPRYKGRYPKEFKDKYKEQHPELYSADIERVIAKGRTPAGMHLPICVSEIMEFLNIQPGQRGLDATLGYGGHSLEILKRLYPGGLLYALDVDPFELPRTTARLSVLGFGTDTFIPRQMNFSEIDVLAAESGPLDFVLADLGVSSMQIDNPDRGFSLKTEGPLDLRLNPNAGNPASEFLKTITLERLEEILLHNSDEPDCDVIASAIITKLRNHMNIETTTQLRKIITDALQIHRPDLSADDIKKSCQRCFQALRIEVNNEFGALEEFLDKLPDALKPGGRAAILTFHSGEDRRVKKSFQYLFRQGIYSEVAPEPIRASKEECFKNRRARSAKLRWAVKAV